MAVDVVKGTRDFPPEVMIARQRIADIVRKVFESYGFNPLETPTFEYYETMASKFAGGSEILKETYKFTDQGQRELALRYDLTVPFSRFIAMNPMLRLPFKRYQIGPVFRDGPIKSGRYREFTQMDVDVVGSSSMLSDAEIIQLTLDVFRKLKIDAVIKINNRKLLDEMMEYSGIPKEKRDSAILSMDKLEKIGLEGVRKELEKIIPASSINKLFALLKLKTLNDFKKVLPSSEGLKEIEEVISYVKSSKVVFTPSLARGLAYYTGTIFEGFSEKLSSSICAGGRYDKMIGNLVGRGDYPAVGISFGLDILSEVVKKDSAEKSVVKVYVIPIKTQKESFDILRKLREASVNSDMDIKEKGITKNLDYADKYGIPYVIIVGQEELKKGKLKLKDMKSGKEEFLSIEEIIKKLQ